MRVPAGGKSAPCVREKTGEPVAAVMDSAPPVEVTVEPVTSNVPVSETASALRDALRFMGRAELWEGQKRNVPRGR